MKALGRHEHIKLLVVAWLVGFAIMSASGWHGPSVNTLFDYGDQMREDALGR